MWAARNGRGTIFAWRATPNVIPPQYFSLYSLWRDRKLYEYGLRRAGAILT
jgi:hypothetical protein